MTEVIAYYPAGPHVRQETYAAAARAAAEPTLRELAHAGWQVDSSDGPFYYRLSRTAGQVAPEGGNG